MTATLLKVRTLCWKFEPADFANLRLVADLVESICAEYDVDASRRSELELVIAEAMTNAIDHGVLGLDSGMKKSPEGFGRYFVSRAKKLGQLDDGMVSVLVDQLDKNIIGISIEDSGQGFDVAEALRNLQSISLSNNYGRGLHIIRQLCESMHHSGCGNCLLLEFRTK